GDSNRAVVGIGEMAVPGRSVQDRSDGSIRRGLWFYVLDLRPSYDLELVERNVDIVIRVSVNGGLPGHEDLVEHGGDWVEARRLVTVAVQQLYVGDLRIPDQMYVERTVVDIEGGGDARYHDIVDRESTRLNSRHV